MRPMGRWREKVTNSSSSSPMVRRDRLCKVVMMPFW